MDIKKIAGWGAGIVLVVGTGVAADLSAMTTEAKPTTTVTATATAKPEPTQTVAPKPTTTPTVAPKETAKPQPTQTVAPAANLAAPAKPVTVPVAPAKPYIPCSAVGMVSDAQGVCHVVVKAQPVTEEDDYNNMACDGHLCADVNSHPTDANGTYTWSWATGWVLTTPAKKAPVVGPKTPTTVEPYVPASAAQKESTGSTTCNQMAGDPNGIMINGQLVYANGCAPSGK